MSGERDPSAVAAAPDDRRRISGSRTARLTASPIAITWQFHSQQVRIGSPELRETAGSWQGVGTLRREWPRATVHHDGSGPTLGLRRSKEALDQWKSAAFSMTSTGGSDWAHGVAYDLAGLQT